MIRITQSTVKLSISKKFLLNYIEVRQKEQYLENGVWCTND